MVPCMRSLLEAIKGLAESKCMIHKLITNINRRLKLVNNFGKVTMKKMIFDIKLVNVLVSTSLEIEMLRIVQMVVG